MSEENDRSEIDAALHHAVANDEPDKLRTLLQDGADPDTFYEDYNNICSKSIIHIACEKGRYDCVKVLIESGADVTIRDKWAQCPLFYCLLAQFPDVVELLLTHNPAHVNNWDNGGKRPIHIAVETGCAEAVRILLKFGADVNSQMTNGNTATMILCANNEVEDPKAILEMFCDAGLLLEQKDFGGKRTALQV
jgi:ankyrin repeat protein